MFIFYLMIGVGLLLVLYAAARAFTQAQPRQLAVALRWLALIGGAAVAIFLAVTGRLGQAVMLAAVLAPLLARWKAIFNTARNARGPQPGRISDVETASLHMSLDHDTGTMDGTVLRGPWRGRRLAELGPDELLDLLAACRADDPQAAQLLEAYLDRIHPDWRTRGGAADGETGRAEAPAFSGAMSREEACRVLGVAADAGPAAIREAHRRLMMKLHPDVGGSSYLAAKINQAKDVLLGG